MLPDPAPARTATMNEFVDWVRAMPDHKTPPAIEGLFHFPLWVSVIRANSMGINTVVASVGGRRAARFPRLVGGDGKAATDR